IGKFVFPVDFIILDMPEDIKMTLILGRPFLSTAHAKIDVFKRKITLRVGEEKIIFKSIKPASSLVIARKRDTAYQRQVFTRKRVFTTPNTAYSPSARTPWDKPQYTVLA
nr:hypothetical protein [Tanacetum cinerariifolium]